MRSAVHEGAPLNLLTITADGFFKNGKAVRDYAIAQEYRDTEGPDGALYPGICAEVPGPVLAEAFLNLESLLGRQPEFRLSFFRLSLGNIVPPHWAHTDAALTKYLLLVYLTAPAQCKGGTAILQHESGMKTNPVTEEQVQLWRRDTNDQSKWKLRDVTGMAFNRGVVYRTDVFHAALPKEGFGTNPADGRLVLTIFFDVKE